MFGRDGYASASERPETNGGEREQYAANLKENKLSERLCIEKYIRRRKSEDTEWF